MIGSSLTCFKVPVTRKLLQAVQRGHSHLRLPSSRYIGPVSSGL